MTLEDFFTLTEMRDGLSSLARVEELLSMIQKLNGCAPSNLGDAVRQWSTVARVLTATEHKECLNQFLELNGLSFLNKWLQELLNIRTVDNGIVVEESIHSLLASFERLPIDYTRITTSGIGATIELLLDHKSISIKEKAKALYDRWKHARYDDASFKDQVKSGSGESNQPGPPSFHAQRPMLHTHTVIPPCCTGTDEGSCEVESAGTELQESNAIVCADSSALRSSTNKERIPTSEQALSTSLSPPINSHPVLADANLSESIHVSNSCQKLSVTEESPVCVGEGKHSSGTSQFCQEGDAADRCDASASKDVLDSVEEFDKDMSEVILGKSMVTAAEPTISCKFDSNDRDPFASRIPESKGLNGAVDSEQEKCLVSKESIAAANPTGGFEDLSCTASILSNTGDPQFSCQKEEDAMSNAIKDLDHKTNFRNNKSCFSASSDFLKTVGSKVKEDTSQKSELGLECLDDALEVARQVAIAVEREVVDYREPFCSSPEGNSETSASHSPDSEEEKQDQPSTEDAANSSSGSDHSGTSSPEKESEITQNLSSGPENSDQDIESPKTLVPVRESVAKSSKDGCFFDLNTVICSDEPECSTAPFLKMSLNVSAPIAVVASAKGARGLPASLHFGGELGWKGSAATSAFRPASAVRNLDGESTSSGSKQKSIFLDIDLNVADEVPDEPSFVRLLPASSSLPSGDSCVEVGSRTEKLNLDLNRLGDEDASAYPFSSWNMHSHNGERSLSSASSSSYNRQPSHRDFDLNDNPSFPAVGGSRSYGKSSIKASESCGWSTPYDPVIKLLGSNISLTRKDNVNQMQQPFVIPNGIMEPATMSTRPLLPNTNMSVPAYSYSGFLAGPSLAVPATYYTPGSVSYMADPRGAPVAPHVAGPGGFGIPSARAPFIFGAANMPCLSSFGSSRSGLDLNNGMTSAEVGTRGGSFEQFFLQGPRGWMEEQTKIGAEPSSSAKRKEPESGWEHPLFGCKKMASGQ